MEKTEFDEAREFEIEKTALEDFNRREHEALARRLNKGGRDVILNDIASLIEKNKERNTWLRRTWRKIKQTLF